jgi:hypothetical protein
MTTRRLSQRRFSGPVRTASEVSTSVRLISTDRAAQSKHCLTARSSLRDQQKIVQIRRIRSLNVSGLTALTWPKLAPDEDTAELEASLVKSNAPLARLNPGDLMVKTYAAHLANTASSAVQTWADLTSAMCAKSLRVSKHTAWDAALAVRSRSGPTHPTA